MKFILLLTLVISSLSVSAADLPKKSQQEISHLIHYLEVSGCRFNRNGTWYTSVEAVKHINKKYEYLLDKKIVSSAEVFIEKAASESSMSGKPYLVQCGEAQAQPSAKWFTSELESYRKKAGETQ